MLVSGRSLSLVSSFKELVAFHLKHGKETLCPQETGSGQRERDFDNIGDYCALTSSTLCCTEHV